MEIEVFDERCGEITRRSIFPVLEHETIAQSRPVKGQLDCNIKFN